MPTTAMYAARRRSRSHCPNPQPTCAARHAAGTWIDDHMHIDSKNIQARVKSCAIETDKTRYLHMITKHLQMAAQRNRVHQDPPSTRRGDHPNMEHHRHLQAAFARLIRKRNNDRTVACIAVREATPHGILSDTATTWINTIVADECHDNDLPTNHPVNHTMYSHHRWARGTGAQTHTHTH